MADKIIIDVEFNLNKVRQSAKRTGELFEKEIAAPAKKGGNAANFLGSELNSVFAVAKASLTFRAVNALVDGIQNAVRSAIDFQDAIAEINTILPGFNTLNESVVEGINKLSMALGRDRADLARSYYEIVSGGITDAVRSMEVLEAATDASVAGLTSVENAAGAILSVMNAYGKENTSAAETAAKLFETVVIGRTRFEELASKIGQVTAVAANAGVNIDELLGFLGEATRVSGNTARSVTAIRSALLAIIKPSEQAKKQIKVLNDTLGTNLKFDVEALKAKGFTKFMGDIAKAAGRVKGTQEILARLFGNVRGLNVVLSTAAKNSDDLGKAITRIATSTDSLETAKLEKLLTFSDQLAIFGKNMAGLLRPIGDFIVKVSTGALTVANAAMGSKDSLALIHRAAINFFAKDLGVSAQVGMGVLKEFAKTSDQVASEFLESAETLGQGSQILGKGLVKPQNIEGPKVDAVKTDEIEKFESAALGQLRTAFQSVGKDFNMIFSTEKGKENIDAMVGTLKEKFGTDGDALKDLRQQTPFDIMAETSGDAFTFMNQGMLSTQERMKQFAFQAKKLIQMKAANAVGDGFAAMGAGAMNGAEMLKSAGQAIFGAVGNMIITEGKANIATGLGRLLKSYGADGGPLLAQGIAMTALGGFIRAKAGGGGGSDGPSPTGGGGGGGVAPTNVPPQFGPEVLEETEPRTQINVNIEGNVLDSRSSSLQIVELINEAFNRDGVIVEQGV